MNHIQKEQQKETPTTPKEAAITRLEKNLDSLPIWAPSQYARQKVREYPVPWRAPKARVRVQAAGQYGQLRGFDKLILTALVQLWNEQGRGDEGIIHFQIIDLVERLERKRSGELYQALKESLKRLRFCGLEYYQSFFDKEGNELISNPNATILSDLWIVEPRKNRDGSEQGAFTQFTQATLDLAVVRNTLGGYTRPVSLRFLQTLSERGLLFESYINSVLYRHERVMKDVFDLWRDLGLSTKGNAYASQIAPKMKKDLDLITKEPLCLLGDYAFTKSKTRDRGLNLILRRRRGMTVEQALDMQEVKQNLREMNSQKSRNPGLQLARISPDELTPTERGGAISSQKVELLVDEIKERLRDKSKDDRNLRKIARVMPYSEIEHGIHEAWARFRDGMTPNPTRYFVGVMKKKAAEQGIKLGLPKAANDLRLRHREGP